MARIRQSRPDSGIDCQERVLRTFEIVPSSIGACDRLRVGWLNWISRRCRGVTYPESYLTKYTTYTKTETAASFSWYSPAKLSGSDAPICTYDPLTAS
jgi:hypothetical protein